MIKCIIIDDEPLAQQVLEKYIEQTSNMQLVKKCINALEAFEIISKTKIDLMFLDIKMPSINGIEFIKTLKNPPEVIFTTAFSQYAVESYELNAIDYLLKPVTYERFIISISKFSRFQVQSKPKANYCYFKVNGKLIKIAHSEIICAQSFKDYIIIRTIDDNQITHMTMKYLVELLPKDLFKQVHRSFLINILHIKVIKNNIIEVGNIKVPIGKIYQKTLMKSISEGFFK